MHHFGRRVYLTAAAMLLTIDWDGARKRARALRLLVKRILRKCGYPPDKQGAGDKNGARAGRGAL